MIHVLTPTAVVWTLVLGHGHVISFFTSISCNLLINSDNRWRATYLDTYKVNVALVRVMDLYRQVTSHYLSQYWPKSMSPYGVTRPQWVNSVWVLKLSSAACWEPTVWRQPSAILTICVYMYIYKVGCKEIYFFFQFCVCIISA